MIYQFINNIDRYHFVPFGGIVLFSVMLLRRINLSANTIIGAFVGVFIVILLQQYFLITDSTFLSSMKKILKREEFVGAEHLYTDSELVIFLDTNIDLKEYNSEIFSEFVILIDKFLDLRNQLANFKTADYGLDFTNLVSLKNKILNTYHSFIHTLPATDSTLQKFHAQMEKLKNILNCHIEFIHEKVKKYTKIDGINASTEIYINTYPKPMGSKDNWYFFPEE